MKRALGRIGVALMLATAAFPAAAALQTDAPVTSQNPAKPSGDVVAQRKDVDEVSKPEPPSGPATPSPYCSPGAPVCP